MVATLMIPFLCKITGFSEMALEMMQAMHLNYVQYDYNDQISIQT